MKRMEHHEYFKVRLLSGSRSARISAAEVDDQDEVFAQGYHLSPWRTMLLCAACLLTGGILLLLMYWRRDWALRISHTKCPVFLADRLLISDKFKRFYVVSMRMMKFDENGNLISRSYQTKSRTAKLKDESLKVLVENLGNSKWIINHIQGKGRVVFFKFKKFCYFWHADEQEFQQISGIDEDVLTSTLLNSQPLSTDEAHFRARLFGYNSIVIKVPWIITILFKEALTPFFIFQLFSVILWFFETYTTYAIAIIVMAVFSLSLTVYSTRSALVKLQHMISKESIEDVTIVRQNEYLKTNCKHLVPGDIIEIAPEGQPILCDAVLIDGVCVLDESMLTGESVPVTKIPLHNSRDSTLFNAKTHSKSTLLRGTKVLQARPTAGSSYKDRPVRAVVIRTGWHTSKGALLQAILFPKPVDFRLERDSYKFVGALALFSVAGMIYSIIVLSRMGTAAREVVIRTLDIVTITIPPILPASLTVGIFFALRRLKNYNIFCISPRSINMSGDVDSVVFDKTGTLTQEGIIIKCIIPSKDSSFKNEIEVCGNDMFSTPLVQGMAACHSLNIINGKMFGDSVDTAMFNFAKWNISDHDARNSRSAVFTVRPNLSTEQLQSNVEISIFRIYPFESSLQRQSTIVRYVNENNYKLFVKGSPEMISSLCVQNTLPVDFKEVFINFAKEGYRILALASKNLNIADNQVQTISREEIESNLKFEGLIVCENKIKVETPSVISHLQHAGIRPVMATGDNLLTALNVARSCMFFDVDASLYLVEWNKEEHRLTYSLLDEKRTANHQTSRKKFISQPYYLAMTGNTWEMMRQNEPYLLQRFAALGVVFARMASYQKAQLVEALQEMKCKVAVCGDGTNDCEALRAANSGVSLSKAEASIACAFTAQKGNIGAIIDVIREGRCALVTSFGLFQYLMCYSMLQFGSCIILYWIGSNLTDGQFLYEDIAAVLPLTITFGMSSANPLLDRRKPCVHLMSVYNIFVVLFHLFLNFGSQILVFSIIRSQTWFYPFVKIDSTYVMSFEETGIFTVSIFQYITLAAVYAQGLPFRKPLNTNYIFIANLLLIICITLALLITDDPNVVYFFKTLPIPSLKFKIIIFGIALATALISLIFDFFVNKTILFTWLNKTKERPFDAIVKNAELDHQWPIMRDEDSRRTTAQIFNEGKENAGFN